MQPEAFATLLANGVLFWIGCWIGRIIFVLWVGEWRMRLWRAAPSCRLWHHCRTRDVYVFWPVIFIADWIVQIGAPPGAVIYWTGRPPGMPRWLWSWMNRTLIFPSEVIR